MLLCCYCLCVLLSFALLLHFFVLPTFLLPSGGPSAYFRAHGLKAQVVFLPNGMIGSVYIASMRHNDNGILNMSNLANALATLLAPLALPPLGLFLPALYADGIFASLSTIMPRYRSPNDTQKRINIRMSGMRQIIEHSFADHKTMFALFGSPARLRLFFTGVFVRKMLLTSFLILNCRYCLTGVRSSVFGIPPLSLEKYLPLDEVLAPAPPESDNVFDYQYVYY